MTRSSFGDWNYYGGPPKQYKATEEERYNSAQPPGGDYANWTWIPNMGWQYVGNEEDGTAGMSSRIDKETGERVHYEPERTFDRDDKLWNMQRPLIGGRQAWENGADIYGKTEGGIYNAETNPYVYTDEMRARDEAAAVGTMAHSGVYDPVTNTTMFGGMSYAGDQTAGKTEADYSAEDWEWMNTGRYYEGHDQISDAGRAAWEEAMAGRGGGGPLIDTFHHDVSPLLDAYNNKNYNPFYGSVTQATTDRSRELGHIGEGKTAYERRSENNIMDYLYREFGSVDQAKNRSAVGDAWDKYLKDNNLDAKHFYNAKMTESTFKKMGLDKYKDFNAEFNTSAGGGIPDNPFGDTSGGGGSFSGARNKERMSTAARGMMSDDRGFGPQPGDAPRHSGSMGVNPFSKPKEGGFLDTYMKRKNESKPSVMSLMKEVEEYK